MALETIDLSWLCELLNSHRTQSTKCVVYWRMFSVDPFFHRGGFLQLTAAHPPWRSSGERLVDAFCL